MPPASKKDTALYGVQRPKKLKGSEISSSNSFAFTSQLSSLISNSATRSEKTVGRQRPKKEDIFSTHNKNVKKRALKDLEDSDFTQKHSTSSDAVDEATWHRAKRRMEEKARLYAAMKRGDVEDENEKYAVDFDRKWVEAQETGAANEDTSEGEDDDASDEELVEYVDEFGRTRQGTKAEVAREQRIMNGGTDEPDRFTARPKMPSNIIYGATIQTNAFNPEEPVAAQMAELAANRDKEPTPPPDEHFDGRKEIRTKGVGFFAFSGDNDERKRQMEALEKERAETERKRADLVKRREERQKEMEERQKLVSETKSKAQADKFLHSLMGEISENLPTEKAPSPKHKHHENDQS
ncbi:hypothetical protein BT63DRAFT_148701 [Microthyrium microscopicum]|uniref:Uncharacterized protein n=1 Tax=Microthyrium microscopicum TaxID=703497 RepID=A0A6A6UQ11_9PEZI|nr:hypothetical protein BT63DRAFT_148701 [Microthyrium microscopicum]